MKKRVQIDVSLLFLVILFTGFLYLNRHIYFISFGADNVLDFLGVIVILKGVLLRMSARGHKKAHSREGDRLVETGPYVLTRNPMYLGSFLIGVGFALIVWPWWSLPIFIVFFYTRFIVQIKKEEEHLAKLFPNDFTAYCRRAPRLLPSIKTILKTSPTYIFKMDEAFCTKEKWGLLCWPILAIFLELLQERFVFGVSDPFFLTCNFVLAITIVTLYVVVIFFHSKYFAG